MGLALDAGALTRPVPAFARHQREADGAGHAPHGIFPGEQQATTAGQESMQNPDGDVGLSPTATTIMLAQLVEPVGTGHSPAGAYAVATSPADIHATQFAIDPDVAAQASFFGAALLSGVALAKNVHATRTVPEPVAAPVTPDTPAILPPAPLNLAADAVPSSADVLPTAHITLSDHLLVSGESTTVTISFNEAVSGLSADDFIAENGMLDAPMSNDGGVTWTALFTPDAHVLDPTNVITLASASVSDAAGHLNASSAVSDNYGVDTVTPPGAGNGAELVHAAVPPASASVNMHAASGHQIHVDTAHAQLLIDMAMLRNGI